MSDQFSGFPAVAPQLSTYRDVFTGAPLAPDTALRHPRPVQHPHRSPPCHRETRLGLGPSPGTHPRAAWDPPTGISLASPESHGRENWMNKLRMGSYANERLNRSTRPRCLRCSD
ncbi:unnamed protein product [Lota lota]